MEKRRRENAGSTKSAVFLLLLLAVMIFGARVKKGLAYFTTYATAKGAVEVRLGDDTTVDENFKDWQKEVRISSSKDSQPVYVRAKAFCGSAYSLDYSGTDSRWTENSGDHYWYYSDILYPGGKTEPFYVKIKGVPDKDVQDPADFNVVVIYETTPVLYDNSKKPYGLWDGEEAKVVKTVLKAD